MTSGNELNAHLEGWEKERRKHPFMAFDLNESTIEGCWEEASADYSGENYVMMIGDIIDSMVKRGILRDGDTVLDIGCGTGLFSIPIAGIATRVVCMDGSAGMLGRLEKQCVMEGFQHEREIRSRILIALPCTEQSGLHPEDGILLETQLRLHLIRIPRRWDGDRCLEKARTGHIVQRPGYPLPAWILEDQRNGTGTGVFLIDFRA